MYAVMAYVKIGWLPFVDQGPMILSVTPRLRQLASAALAVFGLALAPGASAAEGDDGWFAPGSPGAPPATRTPPPVTYSQNVYSTSTPEQRMEPLPESPLLQGNAAEPDLDRDPRALTAWNEQLAPYGIWIDDPSYGRVWIPNEAAVGAGFSPYVTGGRWALDEGGEWIWVSEYPFGRIVFHYGRWVWIAGRGWAWVPGLQYAPAWVTWRVPVDATYGYVGWAPLPPSYVWFGGVSIWWGYPLYYPWVFCSSAYVFNPYVHHHIVYDHDGQAHAAHHTRPYYPPRGYVRQPPRGPEPSAANIPPNAVPRQRVSARDVAAAPNPKLGVAGPGAFAAQRKAYSTRDLSTRDLPAATRTRATPSLEPAQQRRSATPSVDRTPTPSFDRSDVRTRTPSFDSRSIGRSTPRMEPMRTPLRSAPLRMSPGVMRMPRR
jgi:hypothetical protein